MTTFRCNSSGSRDLPISTGPGGAKESGILANYRGANKETTDFRLTRMYRLSKYKDMRSISGDKLRGHLEGLVLSVLESGPTHGLEILRRLERAGEGMLTLKEGSLYPALYRLEAAGLLSA